MSWVWSDSIPDDFGASGLEIQDPAGIIPLLVQAINQRMPYFGGSLSFLAIPTTGDAVGTHAFISLLQSTTEDMVRFAGDPSKIVGGVSDFTDCAFTTEDWRTASGISVDGFRRKKPREITSLSASTDMDGNTCASGMRARYVGDHSAHPAEWGKVVKYDGSTWSIPSPKESCDVLDSQSSAPNTCDAGPAQAGDCFGGWLLRELRDGLNQIYICLNDVITTAKVCYPDGTFFPKARVHAVEVLSFTSLADAQSVADDNYDVAYGTHGFFGGGGSTGGSSGYTATSSIAEIQISALLGTDITAHSEANASKVAEDWYPIGTASVAFEGSLFGTEVDYISFIIGKKTGAAAIDTYDDNGLGITENVFTSFATIKDTMVFGAKNTIIPQVGDSTIDPTWPSAPPDPGGSSRGLRIGLFCVMAVAFPLGSYVATGDSPPMPDCPTAETRCMQVFEATQNCAANKWDVNFISQTCADESDATGWEDDGADAYGHTKKRCVLAGAAVCSDGGDCSDPPDISAYPPPPTDAIDDFGNVFRTYEATANCAECRFDVSYVSYDTTGPATGWNEDGVDGDGITKYKIVRKEEAACPPITGDPGSDHYPSPPPASLLDCPITVTLNGVEIDTSCRGLGVSSVFHCPHSESNQSATGDINHAYTPPLLVHNQWEQAITDAAVLEQCDCDCTGHKISDPGTLCTTTVYSDNPTLLATRHGPDDFEVFVGYGGGEFFRGRGPAAHISNLDTAYGNGVFGRNGYAVVTGACI